MPSPPKAKSALSGVKADFPAAIPTLFLNLLALIDVENRPLIRIVFFVFKGVRRLSYTRSIHFSSSLSTNCNLAGGRKTDLHSGSNLSLQAMG